jgi:hypothetical protein
MKEEVKLSLKAKIKKGQLAINELCGMINEKTTQNVDMTLNVPKECEPIVDKGIAILEDIIADKKELGEDYEFDYRMLESFKYQKQII